MRLLARVANEFALWHLDTVGPAHDDALFTALRDGQPCRMRGQRTPYDFRVMFWQAVPPAQREALLAGERVLLQRWGEPRSGVAPLPDPLPQARVRTAVHAIRAGLSKHSRPLAPVLAWTLLQDTEETSAFDTAFQCALHQWWLQQDVNPGAAVDQRLIDFRYGTLLTADRMLRGPAPRGGSPPESAEAYPAFARLWELQGSVAVELTLDAQGGVREARVVERRLTVPGIRGQRAVAFETLLDAPSLARARAMKHAPPTSAGPSRLRFRWSLE